MPCNCCNSNFNDDIDNHSSRSRRRRNKLVRNPFTASDAANAAMMKSSSGDVICRSNRSHDTEDVDKWLTQRLRRRTSILIPSSAHNNEQEYEHPKNIINIVGMELLIRQHATYRTSEFSSQENCSCMSSLLSE